MTALRLRSVVDITPAAEPSLTRRSATSSFSSSSLPRLLIHRDDGNDSSSSSSSSTCVEAHVRQRKDGRFQLVLQSGPDQSPPEIHTTFLLPADTYFESPPEVAATDGAGASAPPKLAFQDPYIAILIHSHSLVLHEVNRAGESSSIWTAGEGWTVALPMETEGVWAHPSPGRGWILQRVAIPPPTLQLPPHVMKSQGMSDPMRWFSLEHVWEDPLPMRMPTTDSYYNWEEERLIWVHSNRGQQLLMTFHTTEQRHTLWAMTEEQPPPNARPLYELTRGRQTVSDFSLLWDDYDDEAEGDSTPLTRQQALAQALKLSSSNQKGPPARRSRPSVTSAVFPTLSEDMIVESSFSATPMIHPRWSWQPVAQKNAPAEASQIFTLTGDDGEESLLALVIAKPGRMGEYEIQYWPLGGDQPASSKDMEYPSLQCYGAQPVQAIPGRTDCLIWLTDGQLVLFRSGLHAMLPFQCPGRLAELKDAVGSRVSLRLDNGRLIRATAALPSSSSWMESLWKILEQSTPLVWSLRLDCVRLQDLLLTKSADIPSTAALEVLVEVLIELDWQKGQLSPPSSGSTEKDPWNVLLESEFHREFSSLFEDKLYLGPSEETSRTATSSWMRQVYLENHPILVHEWQSTMHQGSLAKVFDALHLLWQEALLHIQRRPVGLLELLVKLVRTVLRVDPSNSLAEVYAEECTCYGGDMSSVTALSLDAAKVTHTKFTDFQYCPSVLRWIDSVFGKRETRQCYDKPDEINSVLKRTRLISRVVPMLTSIPTTDARVVETLVEEGFAEAATLREDFPTGLAFPLLDVLYRCRNSESISLSSKGWALVGREDVSRNLANEVITPPEPPLPEKITPPNADHHEGHHHENASDTEFGDVDNDGLVPLELRSSMLFPKDNRVREAARLLRSSRPMFLRVPRSVEVTDHEFEQLKQKKLSLLVQRTLALPIGRGMMTLGGIKPVAAEPLPIPELCLKGRVPPSNATLSLDQAECTPESRLWPEFHNGVAAGLRLPLPEGCKETMSRVTRSWVVYNRPAASQGESEEERSTDLKSQSHGGFLLALGLRGHLTALEMTDLYEYLTEGAVTTTVGVLLGMAANKRGSCDMAISTMLFLHVPSLIPQHFSAIDVASAVQTAAVTGAGLLFQGSSHRMMTEFLLNEIGKRPESDMSAFDREAYTLACGVALGMVNLCVGSSDNAAGLADLQMESRLRRYIEGGEANEDENRRVRETNDRFSIPLASNGSDNEKCSIVHEGNLINTDLTSPAATLALGFMYMKTENRTIASAVDLPNTHFLLEWVRPDFLGLRVLARALILWNDVVPTKEWVQGQIPKVVRDAYTSMRTLAKKASEGNSVRPAFDFDRRSVRQMYVHVLAGACFAIGVRFAGTGDPKAKAILTEYVMELHQLREANDPVSIVSKPEFTILETCLGQASLGLALVMAGTGDLEALKLFKVLRWRHDKDIKFGSHMVYGMAVGLLFLGGGTMTLGREPEHIAAIVTAFFPRFPTQSGDNQYHLQALRHLYALAVVKREICAVDVDTGACVHVPIQFESKDGVPESANVPFLRCNTESPKSVFSVSSDKFYPIKVDLEQLKGTAFFVKNRSSIRRDILSRYSCMPWSSQIETSTTSNFFFTFGQFMDKAKRSDPFLLNHVLDSVSDDAEESLMLYLLLVRELLERKQGVLSYSYLWDVRLTRSYMANQKPATSLLRRETVALFLQRVESYLADMIEAQPNYLRRALILYSEEF